MMSVVGCFVQLEFFAGRITDPKLTSAHRSDAISGVSEDADIERASPDAAKSLLNISASARNVAARGIHEKIDIARWRARSRHHRRLKQRLGADLARCSSRCAGQT